jgi:hypothetical protein
VADPGGELVGDRAAVQALALVADVAGDPLPHRAVPGIRPGERMRHLVQQHLVDLIVVVPCGEQP